jgi:putative transcriptional regulator
MSRQGKLLVASPTLLDPNFHRAVVLLMEDGEDGTLGVVLNRPTSEAIAMHLPGWAHLVTGMPVVFIGGPVQNEVAVAVAETPLPMPDDWSPSLGDIGLLDLTTDPSDLESVGRLRIFSGYSGWEVDQLDAELEEGSWFVLGAHPDDVFGDDPDDLWRQVFARQTGPLAAYSRYPDDPSLN